MLSAKLRRKKKSAQETDAAEQQALGVQTPPDNPFIINAKIMCLQAIIEDTIDKLSLVSSLRNNGVTRDSRGQVGDAMMRRKGLPHDVEGNKVGSLIKEYKKIRTDLEANIAASHQSSSQLGNLIKQEKARMIELLEQTGHELLLKADCPTLRSTVAEEQHTHAQLKELQGEVAQLRSGVAAYTEQVKHEATSFSKANGNMQEKSRRLRERIAQLRQEIATTRRERTVLTQAKLNTKRRLFQVEEEKLRQRVVELREEVVRERKAFQHSQDFLIRKVSKTDTSLREWEQKYSIDVEDVTQQVARMSEKRSEGLTLLHSAEEEHQLEAKRKAERLKVERDIVVFKKLQAESALKIQCAFRCHVARRQLAVLRKERSKKKKKNKSKKKK